MATDVDRMRAIAERVAADGVRVTYVSGWQDRGAPWGRIPVGIVDHHDASSVTSGTWGALATVVSGRPDVPGPLSQFFVARGPESRLAIVAAGRANHAGLGGPLIGVPRDSGNAWLLGVEKANNGIFEDYTDASIEATAALHAACAEVCGFDVSHVIGHKEWAPTRKIDPLYSMDWMRRLVTNVMEGDMALSDEDISKIADLTVRRTWKHRRTPDGAEMSNYLTSLWSSSQRVEKAIGLLANDEAVLTRIIRENAGAGDPAIIREQFLSALRQVLTEGVTPA